MDIIGQFLDENCVTGPRYEVPCAELYAAYDRWCDEGGERSINQRRFGSQMSERGIERQRRNKGWFYIGVGLMTTHYEEEPPSASKPTEATVRAVGETLQQETVCDPCDPCDLNFPVSTREENTRERSGKLDHIDHMDHEGVDSSFVVPPAIDEVVTAPMPEVAPLLPPPGPNFPWSSVRMYLEQGRTDVIAAYCEKLWNADYDAVMWEAGQRFPHLVYEEL